MEEKITTPKDVFLRLFQILAFYLMVIGFITLFIQYINALFPDPLSFYFYGVADTVRFAAAMIIIATPSYMISSWFLGKDIQIMSYKRELKIVKWLIYLTLFVSAVTIVIDLMTFVYNFLSGELTIQFFLKMLVVLLVAIAVFAYFIWELKRTDFESKVPKVLAWALSVFVLISVFGGFLIVGTPSQQRDRRFDDQRVGDLQTLQNEIINYWIQKNMLPETLGALENSISGFAVPIDPEDGSPYGYDVKSPLSFDLCATFKSSVNDSGRDTARFYPYSYQQNWDHKAERTCFDRIIDPQLYKTPKL